jgi:hypothetical protein
MAITEQNAVFAPTVVFAPTDRSRDRAYLAWATVATAYAIAFLQRVSPQSVSLSFMQDFSTDAAGVAMLASSYFWGYTLMQIPAGLLVDRYGVKRVVLFSMAVGLALGGIAQKTSLLEPLAILNRSMTLVTNFVSRLMPFGVFAIVASAAGTMGLDTHGSVERHQSGAGRRVVQQPAAGAHGVHVDGRKRNRPGQRRCRGGGRCVSQRLRRWRSRQNGRSQTGTMCTGTRSPPTSVEAMPHSGWL